MSQLYFFKNISRQIKLVLQILADLLFIYLSEVDAFPKLLQIQNHVKILPCQKDLNRIRTVRGAHNSMNDTQDCAHSELIIILFHFVKYISQPFHNEFWVNYIVIYQINAILSLFENIV